MSATDPGGTGEREGRPQPEAAEEESARLLANDARQTLEPEGFTEEDVRQLADRYVAEDLVSDRGGDPEAFLTWARRVGPSRDA